MKRLACVAIFYAVVAFAGVRPADAQARVPAVAAAQQEAVPAATAPPTAAASPEAIPVAEPIRVGVYVSPPFVMKEDGRYTGMAMDLWNSLAVQMGVRSEYVELDSPAHLVDAAASGKVDIGITNLTVTRERARQVVFSYPWFDGGMRIMVGDAGHSGFGSLVAGLRESGHLRAYAWIALVILIATIGMTVFDRRFDEEFPRSWRKGISESFYSVMSIATSGKTPSRKNLFGWVGRIWQGLWLVCGVAVLAYVTSSVTSVMTTLALTNRINSVADLPGHTIGVRAGSITEDYATEMGLATREYANIDEAVDGLLAGEVAALIGDAPVLEYYAYTNPDKQVTVTGAIFKPDKNAFAMPLGSPLRRPVNLELIHAHQSGQIEDYRTRYFGKRE